MSRAHDQLVNDVLLALGARDDMTVWRNFVGTVRAYSQPKKVFKVGLEGSADIIGLMSSPLISLSGSPNHYGIFAALECKVGKDTQREGQVAFEKMIILRGGLYLVVYSVEEAVRGINEWWTERR